jgi:hypothetical protein
MKVVSEIRAAAPAALQEKPLVQYVLHSKRNANLFALETQMQITLRVVAMQRSTVLAQKVSEQSQMSESQARARAPKRSVNRREQSPS